MTGEKPSRHGNLPRWKRLLFGSLYALLMATVALAMGELSARLLGYKPYVAQQRNITIEPGGSLFTTDQNLGYKVFPGQFRIRLETGHPFTVTNAPTGHRISRSSSLDNGQPEIWIFGCSFAYGYAVDDAGSLPWMLQTRMKDYDIRNYGVPGYGTIHSLIQLRAALKAGEIPLLAVLAYYTNHDERNTFSRRRRKLVASFGRMGPMTQPFGRLDHSGNLTTSMADHVYTPFPLMRFSALSHGLEQAYNEWEERSYDIRAVTQQIIAEMAELCREYGIAFVVADMSRPCDSEETVQFCKEHNIAVTSIAFDWDDNDNWYWPWDTAHPSPLGYRRLTDRLEEYLKLDLFAEQYAQRLESAEETCSTSVDLAQVHLATCLRATDSERAQLEANSALALLDAAAVKCPDDPRIPMYQGDVCVASGENKLAIQHYRRALELEPQNRGIRIRLAWLLATSPRNSDELRGEAVALAMALSDENPMDSSTLQVLAEALANNGQFEEARAAGERALEGAIRTEDYRRVRSILQVIATSREHYETLPAKPDDLFIILADH